MKYYAFYYLARAIISDFKIDLPPPAAPLKQFLEKFLDKMRQVDAGDAVAPSLRDYAKTASLLFMIKKLPDYFQQEISQTQQMPQLVQYCRSQLEAVQQQLEPLRLLALTERHIADFHLNLVAANSKLQGVSIKDSVARGVVHQIYLNEENAKYLDTMTLGLDDSTSLKSDLAMLDSITFDRVFQVLCAKLGEFVKRFEHADPQELVHLIQFCESIIQYCIPLLIRKAKEGIMFTCEPYNALTDADKTKLFTELEHLQLQNAVSYFQTLIKKFKFSDIDSSAINEELSEIENAIDNQKFALAAKKMIDFHRGADLKYPEIFTDSSVKGRFIVCQQELFNLTDLHTPALRDAILPGLAMHYLRAATSKVDAENATPLARILNALPDTDEKHELLSVASGLHAAFEKDPYATIENIDSALLGRFSELVDSFCLYDQGNFAFINPSYKKIATAAGEIQRYLMQMRKLSEPLNEKLLDYQAGSQSKQFFSQILEELALLDNDSFQDLLCNLQAAKKPDDLKDAFNVDLRRIKCTRYHEPLSNRDRMRLCVRQMWIALSTYTKANDSQRVRIVKKYLQLHLTACHPEDRVLSIVALMNAQLESFHVNQASNSRALHKDRVAYIMQRLSKIAQRVGTPIPTEKQVFYQDNVIYSPDSVLEDIVQQLNKEIILLQNSSLKPETTGWLNWGRTLYYGDDGKALQAELEGILQDFKPYYPEHYQALIDVMQDARQQLGANFSMRDKVKCNAAQQKREPDNDTLKKVVTF